MQFLQAGGRWLTRDEIADGALGETAARLAAAVGVRTERPAH